MKGRMDVLNIRNQRLSKSSAIRDIRIETDDEREKENCETELIFETRNKEMEVDLELSKEDRSVSEDVEMDDEDEDEAFLDPQVFSAYNQQEAMEDGNSFLKTRPDIEIKYEDDIEEEDYDSEDSEDMREMPPLSSRPDVDSSNSMWKCKQITHANQIVNFDSSYSNSPYNDSSMSVFNGSITDKLVKNGSRENISLNGSVGRANDSVLLSIVYATINVPFSQVSKCLTAYKLSKSQLSIIRKVRRQVKNRLYAQNCRRRRIAHIKNLADELRQMKTEKKRMFCARAELLARKKAIEKRYSELYDYIMNAVKERCRNENVDYIHDSDDEELEEQLNDERKTLEENKKKLEAGCHTLNAFISKVISERNDKNCFTKSDDENPFNIQLRNMNIVNELAMLNQYYAKNNEASSHDSGDLESNVSVDDSRTSENQLNDFVDYESSISVDESRTEENTSDSFAENEPNLNERILARLNKAKEHDVEMLSRMTNPKIKDVESIDERNCPSPMNEEIKQERASPENFEHIESEDEEDEEEDEEAFSEIEELRYLGAILAQKKEFLQSCYKKLYDHILKAVETNEAEFLKTFMDYCITLLLKTSHKI